MLIEEGGTAPIPFSEHILVKQAESGTKTIKNML